MGLYYSDDERFVICTMDYPPSRHLSEKGLVDTKAATIIQLWWRNLKNPIENDIATSIVIDSDLEVECTSDSGCEFNCDYDSDSNFDSDPECESKCESKCEPTYFEEIFKFINAIFFY
jgi:hypothetical protein